MCVYMYIYKVYNMIIYTYIKIIVAKTEMRSQNLNEGMVLG